MDESRMNKLLIGAFPELKDEFENYVSLQDGIDTGAFLTYEHVFRPRIERALETEDLSFLERAANFIEALYNSGDRYAMSVVYVGILEGLKANCDNQKVLSFLKPVTNTLFRQLVY